jgi:hypothetical protein
MIAATGADWDDNCTPACADGLRTAYRVRLRASQPRYLNGYYVFTRLDVIYTRGRPSYQHHRAIRLKVVAGENGLEW